MRKFLGYAVVVVAFAVAHMAVPGTLQAQEDAAVDRDELYETMSQKATQTHADRQVLQRLLQREAVQDELRSLGVDLQRAQDAARTLEGDRLEAAADVGQEALAGGIEDKTLIIIAAILILPSLILVLTL